MAFVDLEKAFDRASRKVIWWALRKLGVDEWYRECIPMPGAVSVLERGTVKSLK